MRGELRGAQDVRQRGQDGSSAATLCWTPSPTWCFEPFDRSVDVLIGKLRRKIESDPKPPRLIVTVPGEGYRFDALRFRPPQIVEAAPLDTTAKPNGPRVPRASPWLSCPSPTSAAIRSRNISSTA